MKTYTMGAVSLVPLHELLVKGVRPEDSGACGQNLCVVAEWLEVCAPHEVISSSATQDQQLAAAKVLIAAAGNRGGSKFAAVLKAMDALRSVAVAAQ